MYSHERSLVKRLQGKPFALLGVNSDESREELKQVMSKENITWRSWWAGTGGGSIATQWHIEGWPTIYLIDHDGVIRFKSEGAPENTKEFERLIDDLIKDAEDARIAKNP